MPPRQRHLMALRPHNGLIRVPMIGSRGHKAQHTHALPPPPNLTINPAVNELCWISPNSKANVAGVQTRRGLASHARQATKFMFHNAIRHHHQPHTHAQEKKKKKKLKLMQQKVKTDRNLRGCFTAVPANRSHPGHMIDLLNLF